MDGRGQRMQTLNQGWRGGVQKFVSNAVHAVLFRGLHVFPATIADDFLQGNPVAGAAPRGNDHIRILEENSLSGCLFPRRAYELSARSGDQLGYPRLRGDQGLAPFFAEHTRTPDAIRSAADGIDFLLHFVNYFFSPIACAHHSRNGGNICVDIGQCLRCQAKKACAGLQDFRDRLLLVRYCSDHQVWPASDNLIRVGGPGVGDDGYPWADLRTNIHAVFRARDNSIQFADGRENHGGARLQGDDSSGSVVGRHAAIILQGWELGRAGRYETLLHA
jgi:hypothetical protein